MKPIALITDGKNPMGQALALKLYDKGYRLALMNTEKFNFYNQFNDEDLLFLSLDFTSETDVIKMAETVENWGELDCIYFNARDIKVFDIENSTSEDVFKSTDINLKSTFLVCRYFSDQLIKRQKGACVFCGSVHSDKPTGASFVYASSMGGLKMFFREMTLQLGRQGIICTYIECGPVMEDEELLISERSSIYDDLAVLHPRRKPATWDELAQIAIMSASNGTLLNGSEIRADGGYLFAYIER